MREALGDDESDADQRFALDTLSATSLEVVRDYAAAMNALANSSFDQARENFEKAIEQDPRFGLAHAGLAIASANLGNQQDAERHVTEAMRHVDAMTERERFRTRGLYYLVTSDYPSCVKEYGALVARFKADAAARNNAALCSTRLRDINTALAQMREAMAILPNRALYRVNTALYAAYAGDFAAAEAAAAEARDAEPVRSRAARLCADRARPPRRRTQHAARVRAGRRRRRVARGFGFRRHRELRRAVRGSRRLCSRPAWTPTWLPTSPIGRRRSSRRSRTRRPRAATSRPPSQPRTPRSAVAYGENSVSRCANLRRGGCGRSRDSPCDRARRLAASRAPRLRQVIAGEVALAAGDYVAAIKSLDEGNALLDTWIGHYTLGRAYLEAGAFAQADSEFDRCVTRRGEALRCSSTRSRRSPFTHASSTTAGVSTKRSARRGSRNRTSDFSTFAAPRTRTRCSPTCGGESRRPRPLARLSRSRSRSSTRRCGRPSCPCGLAIGCRHQVRHDDVRVRDVALEIFVVSDERRACGLSGRSRAA